MLGCVSKTEFPEAGLGWVSTNTGGNSRTDLKWHLKAVWVLGSTDLIVRMGYGSCWLWLCAPGSPSLVPGLCSEQDIVNEQDIISEQDVINEQDFVGEQDMVSGRWHSPGAHGY